jgi:uncharacterized protein with von Willebrand factor type A (vWA) domain
MEARPLQAIAGFAAYLRESGLSVGVAEQHAMVRATLALPPPEYRRLEAGWRGIVCHDLPGWHRYPELFRAYWFAERITGQARRSGQVRPRRDLREAVAALHHSMTVDAARSAVAGDVQVDGEQPGEDGTPAERAQGGASRTEALGQRDFAEWLPQDLGRLERIVEAIAQRLKRRLLRRQRAAVHGRRLDVRRTLRASLKTGGVPFAPAWLARRRERPRVFVLVDVSRSMETHALLFLRIARAFVDVLDARVFVFHTRLAEVTQMLARDSGRVQEKVNAVTAGFGGGTRIAASLKDFVDLHAGRTISRSSRVLILSDGFDSDPEHELALQLGRIRRRGGRIYWLHPTVQQPQSNAVMLAADLVDGFAPVYNLDSLARVRSLVE